MWVSSDLSLQRVILLVGYELCRRSSVYVRGRKTVEMGDDGTVRSLLYIACCSGSFS